MAVCTVSTVAATERFVVGDTKEFYFHVLKDGEVWDLTGAAATVKFRMPSGAVLTRTGDVVDEPGGIVRYVTLNTDLSAAGTWEVVLRVVQGSVELTHPPIRFRVENSPTPA